MGLIPAYFSAITEISTKGPTEIVHDRRTPHELHSPDQRIFKIDWLSRTGKYLDS